MARERGNETLLPSVPRYIMLAKRKDGVSQETVNTKFVW